jgi:hypothetical protein
MPAKGGVSFVAAFSVVFAVAFLAMTVPMRAASRRWRPEPDDTSFVKACDAFGSGYVVIPGTSSCLSINGYVWYQIGASNDRGGIAAGFAQDHNYYPRDGWINDSRSAVTFDLRTPTEWGALQGQIRLIDDFSNELNWSTPPGGGGRLDVDQAWLRIGGFLAGYTESAWTATQANWISSWGSHSWNGLWYGYQQRQLIQYSFGSDKGVFATLSLESAPDSARYVPDMVAILGYQRNWGAIWTKAGYDREIRRDGPPGYSLSIGTQIDTGPPGSSLRLLLFYADSDNAYGTGGPYHGSGANGTGEGSAEWSFLASCRYQLTPALALSAGGQYFVNFYRALSKRKTGLDGYSVEGTAVWYPFSGLEVRSELEYDKVDGFNGSFGGFLRFTRFF